MFDHPWTLALLGWTLHLLCFGMVSYHCLRNRREALSALLWIGVAWSMPLIGPLLYLGFGVDRVPRKGWRKQVHDARFMAERRERESDAFPLAYWRSMVDMVKSEPVEPVQRSIDRAMDAVLPDFPLLGGNEVTPILDGPAAFEAMTAAIAGARHHIHLQTFILGHDRTGRGFLDLLAAQARAGVTVRLMYDRFGSTRAFLGGLFRRYRDIPNLHIEGWTQANVLKRQFQINLRNHRKILVVDGTQAFCGGINLQNQADAAGVFRDYHFRIRGPAVLELQYTFLRDWNFMTDEGPDRLLQETYLPRQTPAGNTMVRLVNSGPTDERGAFADIVFVALTSAQTSVTVVTPYFVPTRDILAAIRAAAIKGVDVRLVVPLENNHLYAGLAGEALFGELLEAGVRIYRRPRPFMHAKALIVDDCFALVGTGNLDVRSLQLNYETNIAIFSTPFVHRLKQAILEDIAISEQISPSEWEQRSAWKRFAENISSLMTPVL